MIKNVTAACNKLGSGTASVVLAAATPRLPGGSFSCLPGALAASPGFWLCYLLGSPGCATYSGRPRYVTHQTMLLTRLCYSPDYVTHLAMLLTLLQPPSPPSSPLKVPHPSSCPSPQPLTLHVPRHRPIRARLAHTSSRPEPTGGL